MLQSGDSPQARQSVRWWVCGLLLLATTLNYMDRIALNQTSKEVMEAFQLNNTEWGIVESAFSIAFAIGTLSVGWFVDRVGVYWVYPLLVIGWSMAGFFTGFATGFVTLLIFRFALGFFEAGNWPCGIRTTRQVLPPNERTFGNSLFQSGTALGSIITPFIVLACIHYFDRDNPEKWRWPFRIIGLFGLGWVLCWFWITPRKLVDRPSQSTANEVTGSFWRVLADPRYWILAVVIMAVNTSWHTFRVWMPLYLRNQGGYSNEDLQYFSVGFYVCADIGAWTVGLMTLYLTGRGFSLYSCRLLGFGTCVLCLLPVLVIAQVHDTTLFTAIFYLYAFGALGLFTTYFSLSQELTAVHQGKVTGTLGFLNAIYLAILYRVEGGLIDTLGGYQRVLAVAGLPAMVAFLAVAFYWPKPRTETSLD